MFDNIGGKIKALAQFVCFMGIICSIVFGIVIIKTDEDLIFSGIITIIIGSLVSWISSFTLYGFGQLIENTDYLVLSVKKKDHEAEMADREVEMAKLDEHTLKNGGWKCICGKINSPYTGTCSCGIDKNRALKEIV